MTRIVADTRTGLEELALVASRRGADCVAGRNCAASLAQALVDIASVKGQELGESVAALAGLAETAAHLATSFGEQAQDWARHEKARRKLADDWGKLLRSSGNGTPAGTAPGGRS